MSNIRFMARTKDYDKPGRPVAEIECESLVIRNEHNDTIRIFKDMASNAIIISADGQLHLSLHGGNRLSLTAIGVNS